MNPTAEIVTLSTGEKVKICRGKGGRFTVANTSRKWEKAEGLYYVAIILKTINPEMKLHFNICRVLKELFAECMEMKEGVLVKFYTDRNCSCLIHLGINVKQSPSSIVGILKSHSSRKLKNKMSSSQKEHLEQRAGKRKGKSFWGAGYSFAATTPQLPNGFIER